MTEPVIMFARLKKDSTCISVVRDSNRLQVFWQQDYTQILCLIDKVFYEYERKFLIEYPFASCFTEVQLIKLKSSK